MLQVPISKYPIVVVIALKEEALIDPTLNWIVRDLYELYILRCSYKRALHEGYLTYLQPKVQLPGSLYVLYLRKV